MSAKKHGGEGGSAATAVLCSIVIAGAAVFAGVSGGLGQQGPQRAKPVVDSSFSKLINLETGHGLNVLGWVIVSEVVSDLETGEPQRIVLITTDYNVGQVVVRRGVARRTIAGSSSESIETVTLYVAPEMADEFVTHYLDPEAPWAEWPEGFGDCFELTVRLSGELTWLDAADPSDLEVTIAPYEDC